MATLLYDETESLQYLATLLAGSAAFRTWSGASAAALAAATGAAEPGATEQQIAAAAALLVGDLAAAHVYWVSIREAETLRPWALVMIPESMTGEAEVGDGDMPTTKRLAVPVVFERAVTSDEEAACVAAHSDKPLYVSAMNELGAIRQQMEEASRAQNGGWFHIEAVELDYIERASHEAAAKQGDFLRVGYTFTLGVNH